MNLALTTQEKGMLLRKFKSKGMDQYHAWNKVKEINRGQIELGKKLKKKKMKMRDINKQFRKEFEEILLK